MPRLTYDDMLNALGKAQVIGGEEFEYGIWTPNDLKTAIVMHDGVYLEYHTSKPKLYKAKGEGSDKITPLRVFDRKKFGNLETLIAHEDHFDKFDYKKAFEGVNRLHTIGFFPVSSAYNDPEDPYYLSIDTVAKTLYYFRTIAKEQFQEEGIYVPRMEYYAPAFMLGDFIESLAAYGLNTTPILDDIKDVFTSYHLAPKFYTSDLKDGELNEHLVKVEEAFLANFSEDGGGEVSGEVSEASLLDDLRWFEGSPEGKSIGKIIKAATQLDDPKIKGIILGTIAMHTNDLSVLKGDTPAWFKILPEKYIARNMGKDEANVVMKDWQDTTFLAGRINANLKAKFGGDFEWFDDLEMVNDNVPLWLDAIFNPPEEEDEGDDDTYDEEEEEEYYDEEDEEGEASETTDVDDEELEEAIGYFKTSINGVIENILEVYNYMFESGYGVMAPEGMLTLHEDRGVGTLLYIDKVNAARHRSADPIMVDLWARINQIYPLYPVKARSLNDIAKVILYEEDVDGTDVSGQNLYLPYKLMEYAFGRSTNLDEDETKISYLDVDTAKSWEDYRDKVIKASLDKILTIVVRGALRSKMEEGVQFTDNFMHGYIRNDILSKFESAFTNGVLVSKFEAFNHEAVAVKIRIMVSNPNYDLGNTLLLDSIMSVRSNIGRDAGRHPVIHVGKFWEFKHDLDKVTANAAPLFAYRILEKTQEQGIEIPPGTVIMGLDELDQTSFSDNPKGINTPRHTFHSIIAGSRSGKGLLTQTNLVGYIRNRKIIVGVDNKPDMYSLVKHFAPNAAFINGEMYNADNDVFNKLGPDEQQRINNMIKAPAYLNDLGFDPTYVGGLYGILAYVRMVNLMMGVTLARSTSQEARDELGGNNGMVIIVDELNHTAAKFTTFLNMLAPLHVHTGFYSEWKAWKEDGEKKRLEIPGPESFWAGAYFKALKDSADAIQVAISAGYKDFEAGVTDIFAIGQDPKYFIPWGSSQEINEVIGRVNKTTLGIQVASKGSVNLSQALSSLIALGEHDVFLGYNSERSNVLNQGGKDSTAGNRLNQDARMFAYVSSFNQEKKNTIIGSGPKFINANEQLAKDAYYFKPALLLNSAEENGAAWTKANEYAEIAGLPPGKLKELNSDDNGNVHPGVAFQGYLEMMGVSQQEVQEVLSLGVQVLNNAVSKMGYPGTWEEFVFDFRPEWIFSSKSVRDAYASNSPMSHSKIIKQFMDVYPEHFDGSPISKGEDGTDELFEDDLDEAVGKLFGDSVGGSDEFGDSPGESNGPAGDFPENFGRPPEIENFDPKNDASLSDIIESQGNWNGNTGVNRPGRYEMEAADAYTLQPQQLSYEGIVSALMSHIESYIGDWSEVKVVSVNGNSLSLNGVQITTQVGDWAKDPHVPRYLVRAIQSSNIAPIFNWDLLKTMKNVRYISFDSWEFFYIDVMPSLDMGRKFNLSKMFSMFPNLQVVNIGTETFTYETFSDVVGQPTGLERVDAMRNVLSGANSWLGTKRGQSWRFAAESLQDKNLGTWSKTWRVGFGLSASALTGTLGVTSKVSQGALGGGARLLKKFAQDMKQAKESQYELPR